MLDNIPFEIQMEIIKKLPVKSLIQFRSVSKQWKSLIDSSDFITDHSLNQTQPNHLLVCDRTGSVGKYVSIVDDDSFPLHKLCPTVSSIAKLLTFATMIDSSHGLVCLSGYSYDLKNKLIIIWNPSIKKSVKIKLPNKLDAVGFGVCPKTSEPKIVKITRKTNAAVYSLSSGAWRDVSMSLRLPAGFSFSYYQVVVDGVIYWITCNESGSCDKIISFDLTSEEFGVIGIQDSLAHPRRLRISKRKESLVVLNYNKPALVCDVWEMTRNGDPKSVLTKLFTVSFKGSDDSIYQRIVGFRKNGQPIIERHHNHSGDRFLTTLEVYEPCMEHSNDLGTDSCFMTGINSLFIMTYYTESLLLLNHPNSIIH